MEVSHEEIYIIKEYIHFMHIRMLNLLSFYATSNPGQQSDSARYPGQ